MMEAKQTASSTAIYLVLLNFPPHLRYLPENMYLVGVVPGPNKPSLDQINHALHLLVDDFAEFWDPGVHYTRTANHADGHDAWALIIPLVADMLGARQAAGFSSATSKFFCTLCALKIQDIENFDKSSWPKRDLRSHWKYAEAWRDAPTPQARQAIFDQAGIRWSALLDLPYWDPIQYTVVDWMHTCANLFQDHCRRAWAIDSELEGSAELVGGEASKKSYPRPTIEEMIHWLLVVRANDSNLRDVLSGKNCWKGILWHICSDNDLRRAGSKWQLAGAIVEWVSQRIPGPSSKKY